MLWSELNGWCYAGACASRRRPATKWTPDGLTAGEVVESIVNAQNIAQTLRSRSRARRYAGERLYVIKSFSYTGTLIYTKGAIVKEEGREVFYILVSAKTATTEP